MEPNQPVDPTKDKRIGGAFYSVAPAPDGSVWGSMLGFPGAVIRLVPGSNPPETAIAEMYEPPFNNPTIPLEGSHRAEWISTATASYGRRSRADTWPASTAASARDRSTGPKRPASTVPKAGRFIRNRLPQIKGVTDSGSAEGQLLHLGGSVRHVRFGQEYCRSIPAMHPKDCWP